jgi:hypothetical protein
MKEVDEEETQRWLKAFMPLYEQATPLIQGIAKLDADGLPADLGILVEATKKLQPILESARNLSKPKQKKGS